MKKSRYSDSQILAIITLRIVRPKYGGCISTCT
ncbi:MAG: hypothetical protein ACI9NY_001690 [Kiritimatiellia bacterium]|jgi:hypothetical protein